MKKIILFLSFSFFFISFLHAQRLTGTWEGDIDGDEFLQINIVEVAGGKLCGYTWDYPYRDKKDFCKAYFSGEYKKDISYYLVNGYSFMLNSGGHSLMQLTLRLDFEKGRTVLNGFCRVKPTFFSGGGTVYEISLKKVSNKPAMMTQEMRDCVKANEVILTPKKPSIKPPVIQKKVEPIVKKPIPPKKLDSVIKPAVPNSKRKDTLIKAQPPVTKVTTQTNILPTQTNGRVNKEISRIIVTDSKLKLAVYDNGTIDGDTVSIYYNGKVIVSQQRLTSKPIEIDLKLDENTTMHSIVLFAENLGSIPPNTALIIITTASGKRYELFSSATLQQNAALIFEYAPK